MPLPLPKYPMTDFHEINLDYLLKKYCEVDDNLTTQIAGLKLEVNAHNILLKDASNNVLASIVAPYAYEANTAASATRASNADEADVAIKDALGNHIVSYVKTIASIDNVITFYDANGGEVASVGVVTGSNIDLDIYNTSDISETRSLRYTLDRMAVNDEVIYNSNYSAEQIADLFIAGNDIRLKHHYVSSDPDYNGKYSFNAPLYYDGLTKFIMMNTDHNKKYQLISTTTSGTIGIARID